MQHQRLANKLIDWYLKNRRDLPWRKTKDPYIIWLSEVILQQTRVKQGLPYFLSFVSTFPDVKSLATAKEKKVMKLWEGLGYYTRVRNMIETAKMIVSEYKGTFPDSYHELIKLPGIGPYSAAAIASFAFDKKHAVVDGNVFRVLSRYFGKSIPIDTTKGKEEFGVLANQLIDPHRPGLFNQAIMEFGAIQCTPKLPSCTTCILEPDCVGYKENLVTTLPIKSKQIIHRKSFSNYLIIN